MSRDRVAAWCGQLFLMYMPLEDETAFAAITEIENQLQAFPPTEAVAVVGLRVADAEAPLTGTETPLSAEGS